MEQSNSPEILRKADRIIEELREAANPDFRIGMARFGIPLGRALGVHVPVLRALAKRIGRDHELALALYRTEVHEAKILASMIAEPARFTPETMDEWVADFDSWDVCDQCCMNLFRYRPYAFDKVREYAAAERLFTRRAGFALLATLAVGDKQSPDERFAEFLPLIERTALEDDRDAIKKAVNWALRQIGKRNAGLYVRASELAGRLAASDNRTARWVGRDAVREFGLERVRLRAGVKPSEPQY